MKKPSRASKIRKVKELLAKIPPLTKKQEEWAISRLLNEYHTLIINKRNQISCSTCGHVWKDPSYTYSNRNILKNRFAKYSCPQCKRVCDEIKSIYTYHYLTRQIYTYVTSFKNYQVIRYAIVTGKVKPGKPMDISFQETTQRWIDDDNFLLEANKATTNFGGGLAVRSEYSVSHIHNTIIWSNHNVYPIKRFSKKLKTYGFNKLIRGCDPFVQILSFLNLPKAETIYKKGYYELFKHFYKPRCIESDGVKDISENIWPSIKIAMRHKYKITDASLWEDYIQMLRELNKDIKNPTIICPENLHQEHKKVLEKVELKRLKEEEEEEATQSIEYKKILSERKSLFGQKIIDGDITIRPLSSIKDFKQEGYVLKHCVHTNRYYLKKNSICFSVEVKGSRTETIEASLPDLSVIQCRGRHNQPSIYHDQIIEAFNSNKQQFTQVLKQCNQ